MRSQLGLVVDGLEVLIRDDEHVPRILGMQRHQTSNQFVSVDDACGRLALSDLAENRTNPLLNSELAVVVLLLTAGRNCHGSVPVLDKLPIGEVEEIVE